MIKQYTEDRVRMYYVTIKTPLTISTSEKGDTIKLNQSKQDY